MLRYSLRRLLIALPTLLLVSVLLFNVGKFAPGDPVRRLYGEESGQAGNVQQQIALYKANAKAMGMDLPDFYVNLQPASLPDSLHRIFPPERRNRLRSLTLRHGNWSQVAAYDEALNDWLGTLNLLSDTTAAITALRLLSSTLWYEQDALNILKTVEQLAPYLENQHRIQPLYKHLQSTAAELSSPGQSSWIPSFVWYGKQNQYHRWLTGFARGDLGRSLVSRRQVAPDLYPALQVTLTLNGLAILLALVLSVPFSAWMLRRQGHWTDKAGQYALLVLFAMPAFWLGALLMWAFATQGSGLGWLNGAAPGPWVPTLESFGTWVCKNATRLMLPIVTLMLHILAVYTLQMRSSLSMEMDKPYTLTAQAKGLSTSAVIWRHAMPNALFPMIALMAQSLPVIFGGALVLEYLFGIPGMGTKTQEAFLARDYPVLLAITMLGAAVTILANLMADLLYAWLDPRVQFGNN
jgi:peptide/nickel transport system permease protein